MKIKIEDWELRRESFNRHMRDVMDKYHLYCKWFTGDFSDIELEIDGGEEMSMYGETSSVNMTAMVGRSFVAHLFYNAPKVVIKAQPGFSEKLANVETQNANNMVDEGGLYDEGGKVLLHGFLGPNLIMKVGYSADYELDKERIEKERALAREENQEFLAGGTPSVSKEDYHVGHEEIHELQLELIYEGKQQADDSVIAAIKSHIVSHREMREKLGERYPSRLRAERVFFRHKRPDLVFYDQFATDYHSLKYIGEVMLRSRQDIKDSAKARGYKISEKTLPPSATTGDTEGTDYYGHIFETVQDDGVDKVLLVEVFDLVNNEVITYCLGAEEPLSTKPYHMADILPAGPYILSHFDESPTSLAGTPQPAFWEDQQRDVALLNTIEVLCAKASLPGIAYDAEKVDGSTIQAVKSAIMNRAVGFTGVDGNKKISDFFADLPHPQLSQEVLAVKRMAMDLIERQSLMGQVRLGGGDKTRTATASALMNEAVGAMTQRAAVRVDRFFKEVIRAAVRISRKYYSQETVAKAAGDVAYDVWPAMGFRPDQIIDDRGVDIVVGTMRRESTDIELKLMGDLFATVIRHPAYAQSPALQIVGNRLMDHLFKLYGAPVDLSDIEDMIKENPQAFAAPPDAQQGNGRQPQSGSGEPKNMLQGVVNAMGGGGGAASTR